MGYFQSLIVNTIVLHDNNGFASRLRCGRAFIPELKIIDAGLS